MAEEVPATAGQPSVSAVNESTAGCLTVPEPPGTPEHVRKYRRSYFAAAGQRVLHPGLIDDAKQLDQNAVLYTWLQSLLRLATQKDELGKRSADACLDQREAQGPLRKG